MKLVLLRTLEGQALALHSAVCASVLRLAKSSTYSLTPESFVVHGKSSQYGPRDVGPNEVAKMILDTLHRRVHHSHWTLRG